MKAKWKIFLVFNFVIGIPAFILLILLLIALTRFRENEDYLYGSIFSFAMLIVAANSFLNIFVTQRYYPDKLVPSGIRKLNMVAMILTTVVAVGLLIVCLYAATEEFGEDNDYRDNSGKVALAVLFLALVLQVVILVMQGQLAILIGRGHRQKMHSLIDSIGQD